MSKLTFENENAKRNKIKSFTKGFYIALSACMVAAVGVAWAAFSDNFAPPAPIDDTDNYSLTTSRGEKEVEKIVSDVPAETPQDKETEAKQEDVAAPVFMKPVEGAVVNEFSGGQLMYSITMGDWRTHDGVDIKCEAGTKVKVVSDGEVLSVSEDPYLGHTVEIKHSGFTVYYSGLAKTISAKKGDKVKIGHIIGAVDVVPSESLEEAHLHLAVKQNGKFVDPITALGIG